MTPFEYLTVLFSIVLGLAIARPLESLVQLVQNRHSVRVHWLPLLWTASLLQWTIFFWWFSFALSELPAWTMGRLTLAFAYSALLFFLLGLLYPREVKAGFDHYAHFETHRPWFFGALFLTGVADIADTVSKIAIGIGGVGEEALPYWSANIVIWLVGSLIAMRVSNQRFLGAFGVVFLIFTMIGSYNAVGPGQ